MPPIKQNERVFSWVWFGNRVLPALTAAGITAACMGIYHIIKKMEQFESINERVEKIEKSYVEYTLIQRIATALDNAELEGQGNHATKSVSRVLKAEISAKKESVQ
jgi:hypothetical protein